jgi:hypothetical protein
MSVRTVRSQRIQAQVVLRCRQCDSAFMTARAIRLICVAVTLETGVLQRMQMSRPAHSFAMAPSLITFELLVSGNYRDLCQGRGGRGRFWGAAAVVEAHLDLEPVLAGRHDVTEVLAGACSPENERDPD